MGVKRYFMNEKEADAIRKSMYESLLMDENDKIVHWDFDPMRRELREYVDIACGAMNRRMESARRSLNIATVRVRLRCPLPSRIIWLTTI